MNQPEVRKEKEMEAKEQAKAAVRQAASAAVEKMAVCLGGLGV